MEGRALGKGLSALIPEKSAKEEDVLHIKVSEIRNNSLQPRINYDEEKIAELIQSIKEKGVLQPILVRQKDQGYEIIAGERRLRAARALKLEKVPVIIKNVNDQEALVLALVENIQREELNPIEEAQAFSRLINEFSFTQDSVAQSVGKDRSTISNLVRLLKLPEDIQKSVFDGKLSMGHARALLGTEDALLQKKIFQQIISKQLSVREAENLIRFSGKTASGAKKKTSLTKDSYLIVIEEEFQRALGTKVRILAQKKRGKIAIEYYSAEDLDRIKRIITK